MLRVVLVVAAVAMSLPAGAACARAADGGFAAPAAPQVTVKTGCEHQLTPVCLVDLKASRPSSHASRVDHEAAATHPLAPPPTCKYEPDFSYDTSAAVQAGGGPSRFAVYKMVCFQPTGKVGTPFKITPLGPKVPGVDVQSLVAEASKSMVIPAPHTSLSPAAEATQFVGLPLWAWIPASAWAARFVTVSASGVSLTMTAVPAYSVWSMGDGGSMTCKGPGTPYPPASSGKLPRKSPDCGYTYARSSASMPGGVFPVTVKTSWKVTWSTTTGLSGSEPDLTASSSLRLRVSEIQALVTDVQP